MASNKSFEPTRMGSLEMPQRYRRGLFVAIATALVTVASGSEPSVGDAFLKRCLRSGGPKLFLPKLSPTVVGRLLIDVEIGVAGVKHIKILKEEPPEVFRRTAASFLFGLKCKGIPKSLVGQHFELSIGFDRHNRHIEPYLEPSIVLTVQ